MSDAPAFVRLCAACKASARCRAQLGKYWRAKSHGGFGCARPFDDRAAIRTPPRGAPHLHADATTAAEKRNAHRLNAAFRAAVVLPEPPPPDPRKPGVPLSELRRRFKAWR